MLITLWSYNELSCRKIKEHLEENGVNLEKVKDTLKELNINLRNTLKKSPKFDYSSQKIVNNLTFLF